MKIFKDIILTVLYFIGAKMCYILSLLVILILMIGVVGFYHLTMQGRYYDLRGIQVPENCEQIDQVILYPNRDSIAIICEMEVGK